MKRLIKHYKIFLFYQFFHDVVDVSQLFKGLKNGELLQGFLVYVASISEDEDIIAKAPKNLMPGISTFSEFVFEENVEKNSHLVDLDFFGFDRKGASPTCFLATPLTQKGLFLPLNSFFSYPRCDIPSYILYLHS